MKDFEGFAGFAGFVLLMLLAGFLLAAASTLISGWWLESKCELEHDTYSCVRVYVPKGETD